MNKPTNIIKQKTTIKFAAFFVYQCTIWLVFMFCIWIKALERLISDHRSPR